MRDLVALQPVTLIVNGARREVDFLCKTITEGARMGSVVDDAGVTLAIASSRGWELTPAGIARIEAEGPWLRPHGKT